jgi:predicted aspartyl protease
MEVVTSGPTVEFVAARLAAIAIGDSVVENVPVGITLVLPAAPLVDGVLGGDILQRFRVGLDYTASRLRLTPPSEEHAPHPADRAAGAGQSAVPLQIVHNRVLVNARLNHMQQVTLLLDTRAAHTLLHPDAAARLGLRPAIGAPGHTTTVFGGRHIAFPLVQLSAITVGDALVEDLQVGVFLALPDMPAVHGILGGIFCSISSSPWITPPTSSGLPPMQHCGSSQPQRRVSVPHHVSYWLVPAAAERPLWQQLIDTLARTHDAPAFVPHVTI